MCYQCAYEDAISFINEFISDNENIIIVREGIGYINALKQIRIILESKVKFIHV